MGNFPPSDIHNKYSVWHCNHLQEINRLKYKSLYMTDIDSLIYKPEVEGFRLWVEHNYKKPLAVMDLKYDNNGDFVTDGEEVIYNWFEKYNLPCYIVNISYDFLNFRVQRWITKNECKWNEIEYADWLLSLRFYNYTGL